MLRDKRIVIVDWLLVDTKHDDGNLGQWAIAETPSNDLNEYRERVFFPFFKYFFLISAFILSSTWIRYIDRSL